MNNIELEEIKAEHDILSVTRRNVSPISGNGLANVQPSQISCSKIKNGRAVRYWTRNKSMWLNAGFAIPKYGAIADKAKSIHRKPKQKISSKSRIINKKNSNKRKYTAVNGINSLQEECKFTQVGNIDSLRLINGMKRSSRYNANNKHVYSKHMSTCQEPQIINTSFIQENSIKSGDPDYSRLSNNSWNRSWGFVKEPENYQSSFHQQR